MLLIDLKMLDETIGFYEKLATKDLPEQLESFQQIMYDLFDNWMGTHADSYDETFARLLYGPGPGSFSEGEAASLLAVKEQAEKMVHILKESQEVFRAEMNRCEELFYNGLTSGDSILYDKPDSQYAYEGKLFIDYDKAEETGNRLKSLLENECNYWDAPENSQMGKWNHVLEEFDSSLKHSNYHPGNSDYEIHHILDQGFTKLQNFYYSIEMYKKNLEDIEEALAKEFEKQTSEYAKGLTREIFKAAADGEINAKRIWYLSQKSPSSFTPEEMDEIHKIIDFTVGGVPGQDVDVLVQREMQMINQALLRHGPDKIDLDKLFRGYSAALHTRYAKDMTRNRDVNRLSDYFYKDTLQRLTAVDGSLNSDQLRFIMELNPDSLMLGDYRALSGVFDSHVSDVDMESMDRANFFLANCYIKGEVNPENKLDMERSMVFDGWKEYYLDKKENKTAGRDFEILANTEMSGNNEVNTKFLKQGLLQIVSSNAALKLQINGGLSSEDSKTWIPQMGVFKIEDLGTGRMGDYSLTLYQSYRESGRKIEIEYFEYHRSENMSNLLVKGAVSDYKKYKKGFKEYAEEWAGNIVLASAKSALIGGSKGASGPVGLGLDMALKAAEFNHGWNKQTRKNEKIARNLSKFYDGMEMEAYQQGGQLLYVDGVKVVNNSYVDEDKLKFYESKFKAQINAGPKYNRRYSEFFPKGCDEATKESIEKGLQDPNSLEYKNAFINWYIDGIGDGEQNIGQCYKPEEKK